MVENDVDMNHNGLLQVTCYLVRQVNTLFLHKFHFQQHKTEVRFHPQGIHRTLPIDNAPTREQVSVRQIQNGR